MPHGEWETLKVSFLPILITALRNAPSLAMDSATPTATARSTTRRSRPTATAMKATRGRRAAARRRPEAPPTTDSRSSWDCSSRCSSWRWGSPEASHTWRTRSRSSASTKSAATTVSCLGARRSSWRPSASSRSGLALFAEFMTFGSRRMLVELWY